MTTEEIKKVFQNTFNGLPNPVFCNPYKYFEHNGFLCELAASDSASKLDLQRVKKTPLAIFDALLVDCGNWLTVLTTNGERTTFGGHFDTEQELNELLTQF